MTSLTALTLVLSAVSLYSTYGFLFETPDAKPYPREPLMFWGEKLKAWCNLTGVGLGKNKNFHLKLAVENKNEDEKFYDEGKLNYVDENVFAWIPITKNFYVSYVSHLKCLDNQDFLDSTIIYAERPIQNVRKVSVQGNSSHLDVSWSHGAAYLQTWWIDTGVEWSQERLGDRSGEKCETISPTSCRITTDVAHTKDTPPQHIYIRFNVTMASRFLLKRPDPGQFTNRVSEWRSREVKVDLDTKKVTLVALNKQCTS